MLFRSNLKIATKEDLARFQKNQTPVITYGYGKNGPLRQESIPYSLRGNLVEPNPGGFGSKSFNISIEGSQNICSGDSGGPTYAIEEGFIYYIGPTSGTRRPSCLAEPIKDPGFFGGTPLAYKLDLFQKAQEEVARFEAAEAKLADAANSKVSTKPAPKKQTTVTCIKGKTVKKITAVTPRCPSGFTKKN